MPVTNRATRSPTPRCCPSIWVGRCGCSTCATKGWPGTRRGPYSHNKPCWARCAGRIIAYEHISKGLSANDCNIREQHPGDVLAGQLLGAPVNSNIELGVPGNKYVFDNAMLRWEMVAPLMDRASPLRTTHLRDPYGTPHLFGMESFMDEVAVATNSDPIEFKLSYLKVDREHDVINAAARQYGWDTRPSPRNDQTRADIAVGRGFAYRQMHATYVAMIAEVGVHRDSGVIEVQRLVVAHDCGMVINPKTIRHVIECQLVWQLGRTLYERYSSTRTW